MRDFLPIIGFATFDVSDPQNPRQLAIIDSLDGSAFAIDNGYAYIFTVHLSLTSAIRKRRRLYPGCLVYASI